MSARVLYLARHGETEWNTRGIFQGSTDTVLNDRGRMQAVQLSERLKQDRCRVSEVYTSRLQRAAETGRIVAERLGVGCRPIDGLEELGLGDWEGLCYRDASERYPEIFSRWEREKLDTRPPNGETYRELIARLLPALLRAADGSCGDALIITHSACIHTILAVLNGTALETMFKDYYIPNARVFMLDVERIRSAWALWEGK